MCFRVRLRKSKRVKSVRISTKGPIMVIHVQGRRSRTLTLNDAIQVHQMIRDGWLQSRIAAHFDVNSGRISEINTGKKFPNSRSMSFG